MSLLSSFGNSIEAGCDEVGRGCLAGPVVAAAVILPKNFKHSVLNDSKKLTENQRIKIEGDIKQEAVSWAIGEVEPQEVDEMNVLNASYLAMQRAINKLKVAPELLLIDGNRYKPHNSTPFECIIKGDSKYFSIAAASVIAKNYRDKYMKRLSKDFPFYGWETNVGYPTKAHRSGIAAHGISSHHRKSFQLLPNQLDLFS